MGVPGWVEVDADACRKPASAPALQPVPLLIPHSSQKPQPHAAFPSAGQSVPRACWPAEPKNNVLGTGGGAQPSVTGRGRRVSEHSPSRCHRHSMLPLPPELEQTALLWLRTRCSWSRGRVACTFLPLRACCPTVRPAERTPTQPTSTQEAHAQVCRSQGARARKAEGWEELLAPIRATGPSVRLCHAYTVEVAPSG